MNQTAESLAECVEIRIPARAEWVAVARLAIAGIAHRMPFSLEEIEDLKLAIAEACTTAIYSAEPSETIDISCEVLAHSLHIVVLHRQHVAGARPVDPAGTELGLTLIQALMDSVTYSVDLDGGSRLEMTKATQS